VHVLNNHVNSGLPVNPTGNRKEPQTEERYNGNHFEFLDKSTKLSRLLNTATELITSIEDTGVYNSHLDDINTMLFETVTYMQSSECKSLDKKFPTLKDWRHQMYSPMSSIITRNQRIRQYLAMVADGRRQETEFTTFAEELKLTIESTRLRLAELPTIFAQNQFPDKQALLDYHSLSIVVYSALRAVFYDHEETGRVILNFNVYNADCDVQVNPMDIRNIIQNFSTNTIRHGLNGQERIEIDVTLSCQNINDIDSLLIYFKDSGAGMSEQMAEKALERGVKSENSPGDGIGLSLVKQTVERYNGKLHMRTEEGMGTEFLVELPILA
jgi:light-regulated signal transduction histidine kinase (bacteriophytochrome)